MRRMVWLFILGTVLSCAPSSNISWEQLSSEHLDALDEAQWTDPVTAAEALALCLERAAGPFGEGETEAVLCREVSTPPGSPTTWTWHSALRASGSLG